MLNKLIFQKLTIKFTLYFLLAFAFFYYFWAVFQGIHQPAGGFRQAQTGMTIWAFLQGGPLLAYETPVLGAPWSIPFEFPLYQWIVAGFAHLLNSPIDETGRLVSISFYLLTLIPVWKILAQFEVEKTYRIPFLILMLMSPLYIHYSRELMIEVFVVFLGVNYFLFCLKSLQRFNLTNAALMAIFGTLCVIVKVTTFAGFFYASIFALIKNIVEKKQSKHKVIVYGVFSFLIPIIIEFIWVRFTDTQKLQNPLAGFITSEGLKKFNFGSADQYLNVFGFLKGMFFRQAISDAVGQRAVLLVALPCLFFIKKNRKRFFMGLFLYMMTAYTFINLYTVHRYYSVASSLFIVGGFGFLLSELISSTHKKRLLGVIILIFIMMSSVMHFKKNFLQNQIWIDQNWMEFSKEVNQQTDAESVLVIYGEDWSSTLPFLSKRRALMDRENRMISSPEMTKAIENLKPYKLGGVVACDPSGYVAVFEKYKNQLSFFGTHKLPDAVLHKSWVDQKLHNCLFFKTVN